MSCEEDEALFSDLKEIVRNTTNHKDHISETVLVRMASELESQLNYGPLSMKAKHESPISKITANRTPKDLLIPAKYSTGADFNSLIDSLEIVGYTGEWWKSDENGTTFSLTTVPSEFGTSPSLSTQKSSGFCLDFELHCRYREIDDCTIFLGWF